MSAISATWRMYVDLPAMFGPVMIMIWVFAPSSAVSFGTNGSASVRSRTGGGRHGSRPRALGHLRPHVVVFRRRLCERGERVRSARRWAVSCRRAACAADPLPDPRKGRTRCPARGLRREHARLVLLQFGSNVALGVFQRLFPDVVGGDFLLVGVRHLDVVAEDLVIPVPEGGDFRPLDLARLEPGDPRLPSRWMERSSSSSAEYLRG